MDDFNEIVGDSEVIEKKRAKVERYILIFVVIMVGVGVGLAVADPSAITTVVSWFSSTSRLLPPNIVYHEAISGNNLSLNSTAVTPTYNDTFVRFNISYNDNNYDQWHSMVVCNGSDSNYTFESIPGGFNFTCGNNSDELCRFSNVFMTDNPMYCDFFVVGFGNQTQNYTLFMLDSGEQLSNTTGTFVVDRPPFISNISVVVLS